MLNKIAESIRNNKNIIEKKELSPIVKFIDSNSFKNGNRIFSDIGEDSAAIKNNDMYILVTTDRIKTAFIENFPYGAGFSSILVSVDDIYACGGTPLAASIIISYKNEEIGKKILEGVCEGSKKFQVPIIRGHTNTHSKCYELSSTMIGEIKKQDYISAGNAKVGDNIILAVDFDGKVGKASKFYFDTTTFKNSYEVLKKRKAMNLIAEKQLAHSSKDISNGGIFGTILQLIKYSNVGANININKIEIPEQLIELKYTLEKYIKMYLTTSFVLTAPDKNCKELISIFEKYGLHANVIGKIINEKNLLKINNGLEENSINVIRF
ncbi:MAG: AIR synthase related protein [Candidatus Hermodarchaeota archaeon]